MRERLSDHNSVLRVYGQNKKIKQGKKEMDQKIKLTQMTKTAG